MRYGTGMGLVIAAGFLWSLQGLLFRQIGTADPWPILVWRCLGMLPVLIGLVAWRSGGRPVAALLSVGRAGVLGGFSLVCAFGGTIVAFQATTVATAVFLYASAPLLTAVLGWAILGERVTGHTWAAIALALAGIFVMVQDGLGPTGGLGVAAALVCALGFALFTVSLRWRQVADSLPTVLLGALLGIAVGAAAALVTGQPLLIPAADAAWAFGIGAVTLTGGMALYTLGARVVPAADLALLSNVEVMLSPVWVWIFLDETDSPATLVGGAIILAAILYNAAAGARRRAVA